MQSQTAIDLQPGTTTVAAETSGIDYRSVYQSLPVPAGILDANFNYIDFNDAFANLLGYSRDELIGASSIEIVAPESVAAVNATRESYLGGMSTSTTAERIILTKSGRPLTVVMQMSPIDIGTGRNYLLVYTETDEARQHEKLLLSRAEMFRVAIDQSPLPLTLQDEKYRMVLVNQAYCKMSGYSAEELLGKDPIELQANSSRSEILAQRSGFSGGDYDLATQRTDIRYLVTKGGEILPYRLLTRRSIGVDGSKLLCCVAEDLTKIEQAEAALESERDWLYRVFDQAPVGLFLTSNDGNKFRSNDALHAMIGSDDDRVLRQLLPRKSEAGDGGDAPIVSDRIALRKPGRDTQWLDRTSSQVVHPDGNARIFTIVTDATVEQQLQADLQSAAAHQSALLHSMDAGIAHVVGELIVRVNPALLKVCGRNEDALLGQPVEVLFEDPKCWPEICADPAVGSDAQAKTHIVELRCGSEASRRCEVSVRRVDPMRADLGLLLTINDVSELLNQNDDLSRSLAELENFIDTEPLGFAQIEAGKIVRVNKAMRELMQSDSDELVGRPFDAFCEVGKDFSRIVKSTIHRDDGPHTFRATILGAKGLRTDCALHLAPSGDPDRQAFMILALDLSGQARVASLALKLQNRFEVFSSLLDEAMVVIENSTNQIIHANAALGDVFGLDPSAVLNSKSNALWTHLEESDRLVASTKLRSLSSGQVNWSIVRVMHPESGPLSLRLRMFIGEGARESFVLAEDVTANLELEQQRIDDAVSQKDNLVREVHHRIKNNLQGVAGLLQQSAMREPQLAEILGEVASQIHAVAQVHGLQIRDQLLSPEDVVRAISDNLQHTFGHNGGVQFQAQGSDTVWLVPEQEAVPLALVINEIVTNAFKHGDKFEPIAVSISSDADGITITVRNAGELPPDFDLTNQPVSPNGLGLIKALMPRRGANLSLRQVNRYVETSINLQAPAVRLSDPAGVQNNVPA